MNGCEGKLYYTKRVDGMPDMYVPFEAYLNDFRRRIQQRITDVEDVCYAAEKGKGKDEWSDYTASKFAVCRKGLLDISDEIGAMIANMAFDCEYTMPNDELDNEEVENETRRVLRTIFSKKK